MRTGRKGSEPEWLGLLTALLMAIFAWPGSEARAQALGEAMSVAEIQNCLCQKQQIDDYRRNLAVAQTVLQERQAELTGLQSQVEQQRANLSRSDSVGQQLLKDMMAQEREVRELIQMDLVPAYNAQVADMKVLVDAYNQQCTTKVQYPEDVKKAEAALNCGSQ